MGVVGILKVAGGVAGIGGLAVGAFLIIFRDIVRKKIFPQVTKEHAYKLLRLIAILAFGVAIVGIAAYVIIELTIPDEIPTGFFEIWSQPDDAEICILKDGSVISSGSRTPDTIELGLGSYTYILKKHGYQEKTLTFKIERNKQWYRTDTIPLEENTTGWLHIQTKLSHAIIIIDTTKLQQNYTPAVVELEEGEHWLEVRKPHETRNTHMYSQKQLVSIERSCTTDVNLNTGSWLLIRK